jgi:hypothetical protein
MSTVVVEGVACASNISPRGKQRRLRVGTAMAVVSVVIVALLAVLHVAWFWRAVVFLPVMASVSSLLQVSRNTCVARAREGTFEHDDMTTVKAADDDARRSRIVAATIVRDGIIVGALVAALSMALGAFGV